MGNQYSSFELTMLFFGDSFFFQTLLSSHQDVIFFFSLREKNKLMLSYN